MAIEFSRSLHGGWVGAGVWGIEFVLQIIRLAEVFPTTTPNLHNYPLAIDRLSAFHSYDWVPDLCDLVARIAGFFDGSVKTVELLLQRRPDVGTQLLRRN